MLDLSKMKKVTRIREPHGRMHTCVSYNPKSKKLYIPNPLIAKFLPGDKAVDVYIDENNKYVVFCSGVDYKFCKRSELRRGGELLIVGLPLEKGRYNIIGAHCAPGQLCISYR